MQRPTLTKSSWYWRKNKTEHINTKQEGLSGTAPFAVMPEWTNFTKRFLIHH